MGKISVKIKLMPSSPSVDLKKIKDEAKKTIENNSGTGCFFEEEPIAFGLKAVVVFFTYPEEKELDALEHALGKIKDVNSVQIVDIRRAM